MANIACMADQLTYAVAYDIHDPPAETPITSEIEGAQLRNLSV